MSETNDSRRNPMIVGQKIKEALPEGVPTEELDKMVRDFYYDVPERWPLCFRALSWWVSKTVAHKIGSVLDEKWVPVIAILEEKTEDEVREQYCKFS